MLVSLEFFLVLKKLESSELNYMCSDVICTDYDAEYDATDGVCKCKSGLLSSSFGCQPFATEDQMGIEITSAIKSRLDTVSWTKSPGNKLPKLKSFWTQMSKKASKKALNVCGKRSRQANSGYANGELYSYII